MMENNHLTKGDDCWILKSEGGETEKLLREGKAAAVKEAAELLAHETASLKIHNLDGTIEEERTFTRSADPRESEGCRRADLPVQFAA